MQQTGLGLPGRSKGLTLCGTQPVGCIALRSAVQRRTTAVAGAWLLTLAVPACDGHRARELGPRPSGASL